MKLFDHIVNSLTPRQDRVQIVLDLETDAQGMQKARQLLDALQGQPTQHYFNQPSTEAVLVINTGEKAWKDALMCLAGQGFGKMMAVHPLPPKD